MFSAIHLLGPEEKFLSNPTTQYSITHTQFKLYNSLQFYFFSTVYRFYCFGEGETPQEVCEHNAVGKRSECKSSFDELVKGG